MDAVDAQESTAREGSGAMFDLIAPRYDLLNRVMSFGLDGWWRRRLVRALGVCGPGRLLDVATGTGDVALTIRRRHRACTVVGLDPSPNMLDVGRHKIRQAGLEAGIGLVVGDAQRLPFADGCFEGACIAFGIRNVPDRLQGLREMRRVTRPGGRVAVLELTEPRRGLLARLARIHVHHIVPWLGSRLSGRAPYQYLQRSIKAFPPPSEFLTLMQQAGLVRVEGRRLSFGAVHLFWGEVAP